MLEYLSISDEFFRSCFFWTEGDTDFTGSLGLPSRVLIVLLSKFVVEFAVGVALSLRFNASGIGYPPLDYFT